MGSNPGVLYGLCKVHKGIEGKSTPFRPILSSIGTCTYNLAKFFIPLLKDHTSNCYTVKDSFSFADEIVMQDSSLFMATFDVHSLFSNIPLEETIDICVNTLFHRKKKAKDLLKRHCKELLTLATKSSCFLFNQQYYRQLDGVAMGSPLGPTFANLFLCHHETTWLNDCPHQFKPVYYWRYVDDLVMLFKNKDHVLKFFRYLNSKHKNIQFSFEEEVDGKLSYLDVEISRKEGKFSTSIFRKKTFSGVYSNYESYLPMQYKKGFIRTLLFRAFSISSDYINLNDEISKLKIIWSKNDFPQYFIDKCIFNFLNKIFCREIREKTVSEKK